MVVAGTDEEEEASATECDLTAYRGGSCETLSGDVSFGGCQYVHTIADNRDDSPDGTDSLANIEVMQFADGEISHAKHLEHEATHLRCRTDQCVAKDNPHEAKCLHECIDVCPSVSDECTDEGPPCAEALEAPFRADDAELVAQFDGALLQICGPDGPVASVAPNFCQT